MVGASSSTPSTNDPNQCRRRRWRPPAWAYSAIAGGAAYWATIDGGNNVAIPATASVMAVVQTMVATRRR